MYEKRNRKEKQGQLHMLCIDDLAPENHMLRDIDKAIDFSFIYMRLKECTVILTVDVPEIDPVSLFRLFVNRLGVNFLISLKKSISTVSVCQFLLITYSQFTLHLNYVCRFFWRE